MYNISDMQREIADLLMRSHDKGETPLPEYLITAVLESHPLTPLCQGAEREFESCVRFDSVKQNVKSVLIKNKVKERNNAIERVNGALAEIIQDAYSLPRGIVLARNMTADDWRWKAAEHEAQGVGHFKHRDACLLIAFELDKQNKKPEWPSDKSANLWQ